MYSLFFYERNQMKKILYFVLFIIISFTIFINTYIQEKNNYTLTLTKIGENGPAVYHVFLSSDEDDKEKIYNVIDDALEKNKGNIYCNGVDMNGIYTKYILAYNDMVFEDISIGTGHFFEREDYNSSKYLSIEKTDDPLCIGRINSFGKNISFNIKTLKDYFNNNTDPLNRSFVVCIDNYKNYNSFKEQLKNNEITVTEDNSTQGTSVNSPSILIIVYITIIILSIITFYDLLMSSKKHAVKLLQGYSIKTICIESVIKLALLEIISFIIVFIMLSLILFDDYNQLYYDFILSIIKSFIFVLILTIIFNLIPFIYLKTISVNDAIKNRLPIKHINRFNIILKSVLSIILIGFALAVVTQIYAYYSLNNNKYNDWEKLRNYAYITSERINVNSDFTGDKEEDYKNYKELYKELNEKGGIYGNFSYFSPLYADVFDETDFVPRMSVGVNNNYLKTFPIKDENGTNITVSEDEVDTIVIVPLKYEDKLSEITEYFSSDFSPTNNVKIIWAEDNQEYFTMLVDTAIDNHNKIKDPILYVLTENNAEEYDYQIVVQDNYLIPVSDYKNSQATINNILAKYYDPQEVTFVSSSVYEAVEDQIAQNNLKIKIYSIILVLVLISEVLITIQNITIHIEHFIVHIAVKKTLGFGVIDRYRDIFIDSLLSNISVTIISLLIFRNLKTILIGLIILTMDLLMTYMYIQIKDKKSIIEYTKRG